MTELRAYLFDGGRHVAVIMHPDTFTGSVRSLAEHYKVVFDHNVVIGSLWFLTLDQWKVCEEQFKKQEGTPHDSGQDN